MLLPRPVRRRLDARADRAREEGFRAGVAHAAALRARERFDYVFVVTYGRSGSTLVQGLLNAFPRTLVRGENDLYLLDLYRALARVRAFRDLHGEHGSRNVVSAFYGLKAIRRSAFLQAMNDVVRLGVIGNLDGADYDVLGFKEVVWHRIEPGEASGFFDAMDKAFPGVRYVLNTRDVDRALGSGFWRDTDQEQARALIERVLEIQQHLRETRPDRVHDVRYEELTDPERRDDVVRSLGRFVTGAELAPEVLDRAREVLSTGHGPFPFARQDTAPVLPD